jgi:hypothetical protein
MSAIEVTKTLQIAKAALDGLLGESSPRTLTVREALAELAKDAALPAASKAAVEAILKLDVFESTSSISITVANDPDQQVPTSQDGSIAAIAAKPSDSAVAENLADVSKKVATGAAEIAKMVEGQTGEYAVAVKTLVTKAGSATDKLEEVKSLFGIVIKDDDEEWRIRCKVGDLVSMLIQQAALERMIGTAPPATKSETTKAAKPAFAFPADLAAAEFDAATGVFKSAEPRWGKD